MQPERRRQTGGAIDGTTGGDADPSDGSAAPDVGAPDGAAPDAEAPLPDLGPRPDMMPPPEECLAERPDIQQPFLDLEPRCSAPGGPLRIRDIRDTRCPEYEALPDHAPGRQVVLDEAIVTAVFDPHLTVTDPEGGGYASLYVYNRLHLPIEDIVPGSRIRLRGNVIDFYTLTELIPDPEDGIELLGQGPAPEPFLVTDPARIADGGDLAEPLESSLLQVRDVQVTTTAPDCPSDFGMFVVTGGLRVGDEGEHGYLPANADAIPSLVGVLHYSFDHWKLFPRGPEDVDLVPCGGLPDKCETDECPVEADAPESGSLIVTELQIDPRGDDRYGEYVELYNPGGAPLDVDGWVVQDCAGNTAELSGSIPPREYLVLGSSLDPEEAGGARADASLGDLFLPNGSGQVLVFERDGNLVDQVRYEPEAPWPTRATGVAIELVEPASDNRLGESWVGASREYGPGGRGTPGRAYAE